MPEQERAEEQRDYGNCNSSENYLESFSEFEKRAAGHDLPGCGSCAQDAFARFCEVGFPTTHDEDWRFTNVSAIAQTPFRLARERPRPAVATGTGAVPGCGRLACQLVFVNGRFARELSSLGKLPEGVKVGSLAGGDFRQSRRRLSRTSAATSISAAMPLLR